MKRSDLLQLIRDLRSDPETLLTALENCGILDPTYLTPKDSGLYKVNYGWEDECKNDD